MTKSGLASILLQKQVLRRDIAVIKAGLRSRDAVKRCDALEVIEFFGLFEFSGEVRRLLDDKIPEVRVYALSALFRIRDDKFLQTLKHFKSDPDDRVRILSFLFAYIVTRDPQCLQRIQAVLDSIPGNYHAGYVLLHAANQHGLLKSDQAIVRLLVSLCAKLDKDEGLYRDIRKSLEAQSVA